MTSVAGFALNTGGAYAAEDVTGAAFRRRERDRGHRHLELQRRREDRRDDFTGSEGTLRTPVFSDRDVVVHAAAPTTAVSRHPQSARTCTSH